MKIRLARPIGDQDAGLSRRARSLVGQEMFKVLDRAKEIERAGHRVFHLELGDPRIAPPAVLIDSVARHVARGNVGYTSPAGLPELRQAVAGRYSRPGRPLAVDNVAIGPANLLINQFLDLTCDEGDTVALFSPAFPTYWAAAMHIGLRTVGVPLDRSNGYQLTEAAIDQALAARPKAIIVNSANNPTGAVYGSEVMTYLAEQCHRRGIWLLSDETYGELTFGQPFHSLLGVGLPRVAVISSFSKMLSVPAFRTGFLIGAPELVAKVALSNSTLYSCLPTFLQAALAEAMPVMDTYLAGVAAHYADISRRCGEALGTVPGLAFNMPNSGFYFFVDVGVTGLGDMEFCARLLDERHTAVTPGSAFGPAHASQVRIATCGQPDDVMEGVRRVIDFAAAMTAAARGAPSLPDLRRRGR